MWEDWKRPFSICALLHDMEARSKGFPGQAECWLWMVEGRVDMCSHMRSGEQMFFYVASWGTTGAGHGSLLQAQILAKISLSNLSSD